VDPPPNYNTLNSSDEIFGDSASSITNFFLDLDDQNKAHLMKNEPKRTFAMAGFEYQKSLNSQGSHISGTCRLA
jgi:hypothetical protein